MVATALAAPDLLLAQSAKRIYRIATLEDAVESARPGFWRLFHDRLRELGRAAGWDFVIEARYARGATEQLPILAAQLVALKPDIIVTASTPATSAVMKESSSIPIVFVALGDPVATGLVKSFARPGGNATGTSILSGEIGGKWLELLREMQPAAIRIAYLGDASSRASVNTFRRISESAGAIGVSVQMHDAREQKALAQALEKIKRDGTQGLLVGTAGTLRSHRDQIIQFAAQERLPTIYGHPDYVHAGGLISYYGGLRSRVGAWRRLCDPDPEGRQTRGDADRAANQSDDGAQPQDCPSARDHDPGVGAAARRRGDRVNGAAVRCLNQSTRRRWNAFIASSHAVRMG